MKTILASAALVLFVSSPLFSQSQSPSGAPATSQKSISEVARENREAKIRKAAEQTVNLVCSKTDDPKVQAAYPGIQEACKDKPRLVQITVELQLKKQKEEYEKQRVRAHDSSVLEGAAVDETEPADSVAAAQARVDRACRHDLSMTVAQITSTMVDCNKAYDDLQKAMSAQAAAQNRARADSMRGSIPGGDYLISLTGTPGLPVTGTCSFAGKSESYDDILPAQHVATAGRGVICSYVKKYVQGTLKMQIIQNGTVRDQAETEASYGTVSLSVD